MLAFTMTTLPADQPLTTPTSPRAETTFYFVIALPLCGLSLLWPCLARFGVLSGPPEQYMMFAPIAVFSPMITGLLYTLGYFGAATLLFLLDRRAFVGPEQA